MMYMSIARALFNQPYEWSLETIGSQGFSTTDTDWQELSWIYQIKGALWCTIETAKKERE